VWFNNPHVGTLQTSSSIFQPIRLPSVTQTFSRDRKKLSRTQFIGLLRGRKRFHVWGLNSILNAFFWYLTNLVNISQTRSEFDWACKWPGDYNHKRKGVWAIMSASCRLLKMFVLAACRHRPYRQTMTWECVFLSFVMFWLTQIKSNEIMSRNEITYVCTQWAVQSGKQKINT